jgi:hypothetical protein
MLLVGWSTHVSQKQWSIDIIIIIIIIITIIIIIIGWESMQSNFKPFPQ